MTDMERIKLIRERLKQWHPPEQRHARERQIIRREQK